MSRATKLRSSRRSRGSSPGPKKRRLSGTGGTQDDKERVHPGKAHPAQRVETADELGVAAEKHCGIHFLQGRPATVGCAIGVLGGGQTNVSGPIPAPTISLLSRSRPAVEKATEFPVPSSICVIGPSPNKSTHCQSRVMPLPVDGSNRTQKIFLRRFSAVRNSVLHSVDASHSGDSKQITASQRVLACWRASFHLIPGRIPECGSSSRKISLSSGGS